MDTELGCRSRRLTINQFKLTNTNKVNGDDVTSTSGRSSRWLDEIQWRIETPITQRMKCECIDARQRLIERNKRRAAFEYGRLRSGFRVLASCCRGYRPVNEHVNPTRSQLLNVRFSPFKQTDGFVGTINLVNCHPNFGQPSSPGPRPDPDPNWTRTQIWFHWFLASFWVDCRKCNYNCNWTQTRVGPDFVGCWLRFESIAKKNRTKMLQFQTGLVFRIWRKQIDWAQCQNAKFWKNKSRKVTVTFGNWTWTRIGPKMGQDRPGIYQQLVSSTENGPKKEPPPNCIENWLAVCQKKIGLEHQNRSKKSIKNGPKSNSGPKICWKFQSGDNLVEICQKSTQNRGNRTKNGWKSNRKMTANPNLIQNSTNRPKKRPNGTKKWLEIQFKKIGRKPQFDPNQNSPKIHPKTDQMAPKLVEEIQLKIGSKSQLDPRKTKNPAKWHQKWLKIQSKIGSKLQLDPKNPTKNWLKIQPKIGNKPQHDPKTQKPTKWCQNWFWKSNQKLAANLNSIQ